MTVRKAYSNLPLSRCMHLISVRFFGLFIFLFIAMFPCLSYAQEQPEYDEILVFLNVPGIGGTEISAVIRGEELYLPVTDLFDFLKIKNTLSAGMETISGFFINPGATYLISRTENLIRYQDKTFDLKPGDLIRTESNLYLRSSYFGKVFGLDCVFNFRSLSVTLNTRLELPLIIEMRQEEMRRNLTRLKGEEKADTNIGRSYPLFKFGMADWSAIGTEEIHGKSETRLNLALGSMIAGGEATASLNYNTTDPFTEKQQYYLWRRVDNDFKPLRQIIAGKIASQAISSIYNPVIGIQLTNTPTTFRRSFGTYTLSDKTEPGWIVELYVNNVLVDYVKADASGFFKFEVPLVYGNSIVQLKFYGPWGEERTREQNINIPFNFLPRNTLEYTASGGLVEDSLLSRFSRISINYGATRSLTIGGGLEYLSSVTSGPAMPYLNGSLRILNNLLFSGEYTYGVRIKGTLTYRMPSNLQFDLYYTKYEKGQKAINYNYLEERKAVVSLPLKFGKFSSYQRLSLYQIVLPGTNYTTGEWMISGSLLGVSTNLTTYALFIGDAKPNVYSNLSLALRLPAGFILMPQAQYMYTQNSLISVKAELEKHLFAHGFLNLSYEKNFNINIQMAELGFRYDFSFAQTGLSVRQSDNKTSFVEYARGSLINDRKTRYLGTDNRPNVGKGGISIIPYVDLNANGIMDPGEPKAYGLNLHTNGGRVERSERDTTIRILGLEPYTKCFIDLDPNSFDNVSWRLPVKTLSVAVDPNILKHVEIPIIVVGEASGKVNLEKNGEKKGLGRIIISFYTSHNKLYAKTLTEDDGYYSYFGLAPGSYFVLPDTAQIRKLGMKSDPESLKFKINAGINGDIVEGLDFTFHLTAETAAIVDTTKHKVPEKPVIRKDTTIMIVHEVTKETITVSSDSWAIQLGAFRVKSNAEALRAKLERILGTKVEIIIEDNFYKVRINDIKDRKVVDEYIDVLQRNGITEIWVINLKARRQKLLLGQKQDTVTRITETIVQRPPQPVSPEMLIQVGAFRKKSNAIALRDKLAAKLSQPVIIFQENGYYKVRIMGLPILRETVLEEMKKLPPLIGKFGLKDMWILPVKMQPVEVPSIVRYETTPKPVEWIKEVSVFVQPEIKLIEKKIEIPAPPQPTISIQVGVFYKKSLALRAQRRITGKLKLQVDIIPEFDYFRVIIPGFFTRQETYKYYPELAGLGYPGVSLIEKKKK